MPNYLLDIFSLVKAADMSVICQQVTVRIVIVMKSSIIAQTSRTSVLA